MGKSARTEFGFKWENKMLVLTIMLLVFLIICSIAVSFTKNLFNAMLIYMSFSLVMSIVWVILESPDLAITEAAVGAGITSVLFFITLKKIRAISLETSDKHADTVENHKSETLE